MTEPENEDNKPQGSATGMPWDWRRPTKKRFQSRAWNPDDRRLFTPKAFGYGYGINFYWLVHPLRYLHQS